MERKLGRSTIQKENRYHVGSEGPDQHNRASPMGRTEERRDSSREESGDKH